VLNGRRHQSRATDHTMTTASITSTSAAPDVPADALLALFERAGYTRLTPAILQPAEPFLDLSGEDIRKRMYLTTDPQGRELCLRPDLTIPVSRDYLASPSAGTPQGFCYLGPVFRHRKSDVSDFRHSKAKSLGDDGPSEFLQAGIESFGRSDTAAADAEMLALGLEATGHYGLSKPDIRMGDVALFSALVTALDLAPAWKRRLIKDFNHKSSLAHDLDRLSISPSHARPEYQGVLAALAGSDPKAAHALVTDLLSIAGITAVGGRSVGEIADRFLEQAALGAQTSLPKETRALIEKFLAISGDPDEAAAELRAFARQAFVRHAKVALDAALDLFESRTGFLAARGVDVSRIRFSTAFGRGLDYYTGYVFELHDPGARVAGQLVAGGRYDGLLTRLGSPTAIPAVGFAVWIERLAALQGAA
jgi:ATP phosphoribosyltransferase regulatory subunit